MSFGDRYRVIGQLGHGGFAEVVRAIIPGVGHHVAIKVLRGEFDRNPEVLRRFEAEARTAAALRHPASVRLIDFGRTDEGRPFIVTEFIDGPTLEVRVQQSAGLPLPEALSIIETLACALDEAHAKGIIHRDLKPSNVLIERVGRRDYPKLIDWGISKFESVSPSTQPGSLMGTPAFMAPEQTRGDYVSPATDIHALGALLYYCLTGRLPFEADRLPALLDEVARGPRPALPDVGAGALHRDIARLCHSMMAIDPSARPASAWLVAEELRRIHGYLSPGSVGLHVDHTTEMAAAAPALLETIESPMVAPTAAVAPPQPRAVPSTDSSSTASRLETKDIRAQFTPPPVSNRFLSIVFVALLALVAVLAVFH